MKRSKMVVRSRFKAFLTGLGFDAEQVRQFLKNASQDHAHDAGKRLMEAMRFKAEEIVVAADWYIEVLGLAFELIGGMNPNADARAEYSATIDAASAAYMKAKGWEVRDAG
jgi:hypothetical protein